MLVENKEADFCNYLVSVNSKESDDFLNKEKIDMYKFNLQAVEYATYSGGTGRKEHS